MSEKRKRNDADGEVTKSNKKAKHGFRVGPANLPDGTYKRHNDKVKKGLIERALIKKKYAKVKLRFEAEQEAKHHPHQLEAIEEENATEPAVEAVSNEPHPDRLNMMNGPELNEAEDNKASRGDQSQRRRQRKPKPAAYARELDIANRKRAEAEERQAARDKADRERQERIAEREQFRRAMAKSRTSDGSLKLGRQSNALLAKVKRIMSKS